MVGCKPAESIKAQTLQKPKCLAKQSPCLINDKIGMFSITFNVDEVIAEIPFTIFFNYQSNSDYTVQKVIGFLEGKNMFMGKVPLFFNAANNAESRQVFNAETMVVACSEPNMVWNLWITVTLKNASQKVIEKKILVNFSSHY